MKPFKGMLPHGFLQAIGVALSRSLDGIPPAVPVFRPDQNRRQDLEVVGVISCSAGKENEEGGAGQ